MMDIDAIWTNIVSWLTTTGIKVVIGLILVWIAFKIINRIAKRVENKMRKNSHVDITVVSFTGPLIRKISKFFVILCFIAYVGIETSSIVAAITGTGLGVGLALQGALSNLAGGFILLFVRPFVVGDFITVDGVSGSVESIEIFYTTLVTPDNQVVKVPNGKVAASTITNVSVKGIRRMDLTFSISYDSDFNKAKELIRECIEESGLSLKDREPFINISNHNTSSIDIVTRVWVKSSDYWTLHFKLLEDVKTSFDKNGIEIPYSKLDVNIVNKDK